MQRSMSDRTAWRLVAAVGAVVLAGVACLAGWIWVQMRPNRPELPEVSIPHMAANPLTVMYAPGADPKAMRRDPNARMTVKVVSLENADLRKMSFYRAGFQMGNLRGADLRGVDLRQAHLWHANLQDARLDGADLREADLRGVLFGGASLTGARLDGALYDQATSWPQDFDPKEHGATLVNEYGEELEAPSTSAEAPDLRTSDREP